MNERQLISMWSGIGAIIAGMLVLLKESYIHPNSKQAYFAWEPSPVFLFVLWSFAVIIITVGLILTFKDKKDNG